MHIAIDDTYSPGITTASSFVTGDRRTHVAVIFPDEDVQDIRMQMAGCLSEVANLTGVTAKEFHFYDIYNQISSWGNLPNQENLRLFEFFASVYNHYRWPVFIQTIDSRTVSDHGIDSLVGKIDGLDLSNLADLSLLFLLIKLKSRLKKNPEPITLLLDEGRKKPGTPFGFKIFYDWHEKFDGCYSSSATEPLLQISDFIAFCINRSTHLAMKKARTDVDTWFLGLVSKMKIACDDLKLHKLPENFSVIDFDALHLKDRVEKGL